MHNRSCWQFTWTIRALALWQPQVPHRANSNLLFIQTWMQFKQATRVRFYPGGTEKKSPSNGCIWDKPVGRLCSNAIKLKGARHRWNYSAQIHRKRLYKQRNGFAYNQPGPLSPSCIEDPVQTLEECYSKRIPLTRTHMESTPVLKNLLIWSGLTREQSLNSTSSSNYSQRKQKSRYTLEPTGNGIGRFWRCGMKHTTTITSIAARKRNLCPYKIGQTCDVPHA